MEMDVSRQFIEQRVESVARALRVLAIDVMASEPAVLGLYRNSSDARSCTAPTCPCRILAALAALLVDAPRWVAQLEWHGAVEKTRRAAAMRLIDSMHDLHVAVIDRPRAVAGLIESFRPVASGTDEAGPQTVYRSLVAFLELAASTNRWLDGRGPNGEPN